MTKKVLVIAAHPDDEVLGCGATMAKHVQNGDEVNVMILAEGITSRDRVRLREENDHILVRLKEESMKANRILGVSSLSFGVFPDNRMDSVDLLDVVKVIEEKITEVNPDIVYTHFYGDVNIDHCIVHRATITACRPLPGVKNRTVLFFEIASSTEWQAAGEHLRFSPNWYVDVSETINLKLEALQVYEMEMRDWPHARSIESLKHLAHWRGANIGVQAAEAFILGRHIVGG